MIFHFRVAIPSRSNGHNVSDESRKRVEFVDATDARCHRSPRSLSVSGSHITFNIKNAHRTRYRFRDPRTRRLREKQQQQQQRVGEVPEKLSFKEKMKMFALESGENQTPKDKLKISRAQRDIDAVH